MERQKMDEKVIIQQIDPRILADMYGVQHKDEIDLLEYWVALWKKRWLIVLVVFLTSLLAAGYSLTKENTYQAEVLLVVASSDKSSSGGGLSSALSGLGGLAALAGISMPKVGNVEESIAVLKSREFLLRYIQNEKLMPILFEDEWDGETKSWKESDLEKIPTLYNGYLVLESIVSVSIDKKSALITVAVVWKDAGLAAEWANGLIKRLNDHFRNEAMQQSHKKLGYLNDELNKTILGEMRSTLFALIAQEQKKLMLANTQLDYAFRVLDKAVEPQSKYKPNRFFIVIMFTFVIGFITVLWILVWAAVQLRQSEENIE